VLATVPHVVGLTALALDAARLREVQSGLATAMQTTLLPPLPALPGLGLAARYAPARPGLGVGGDWYDAFALPGGAVGLVIGDATGHDTAAISHMAELRHVLRALALDRDEPPGATLTRLERTVADLGVDASATCLYARLEPAVDGVRRLRWSSAGHLPPLLRDGRGTRVLDTPPELMLGVDPAGERADHEVVLAPGDVLLLCTDGLVEERRTDLDTSLVALSAAVQEGAGLDLEALVDQLVLRRRTTEDDAALLAVRLDTRTVRELSSH
jgi:serine phosphatase RsbU (regulator of sigma subunit)